MFKKLKDKIEEEFKQAPLKFPVSVQQLAQVISPSPSVNSLSDNNASSSLNYSTDIPNVSTDFFSIGGNDDSQNGLGKMQMSLQNVELTATSPSNMTHGMSRSRRSSLSSVTSESSSLFPIYESGLNQNFFQSDAESEMEDGMSGQIEKVSKEQLYQSFKKVLNRYNKYKGRYTELMKLYKELQHDSLKTKNVLQESQDKALRRMAELREQCQLEQKAKAHLEESLRNDVEERDHVIDTLKTKITLLSNGESNNAPLINLEGNQEEADSGTDSQSAELSQLKSQNEELQREVERLKKIKETACQLIHRWDTTINEATEDVKSDNLKRKITELKSEIQKMKSENESLSHILSRKIVTEEDKKTQASTDGNLLTDLSGLEFVGEDQRADDEKDKKIEKLNNLLLKCKEKINGLNAEIKSNDLVIENNKKTIKELKEEVETIRAREEENALSVAENKKAIHEELDAKERQIKALTKELKTKENEFIREKEETISGYESKIREMAIDFAREMKSKSDQNQKLMEDLKAREIVSGSLEKYKTIEESFNNVLELLKSKSFAFEELAKFKTVEIEKAQRKLEERLDVAGKNLTELLQSRKESSEEESINERKAFASESRPPLLGSAPLKNSPPDGNAENFHVIEKLKSDVTNLSKKIELLESEVEEARNRLRAETEEAEKWKKNCSRGEEELEKVRGELERALKDREEEMKLMECERESLESATREKMETELKLKEYADKYKRLEKENQSLQNDLMEKCGKLLKDLNESKERSKNLEEEVKAKSVELDSVKRKHSGEEKKKSRELQELKKEWNNLKADTSINQQKFTEELAKLKSESEELRAAAAENSAIRMELQRKNEELMEDRKSLEEKAKELEELRRERTEERESSERLRNELEAIRGNLKGELKEKEEKSILVDKLAKECNLLMGEIESLKKSLSIAENNHRIELESAREGNAKLKELIREMEDNLVVTQGDVEAKARELDDLRERSRSLSADNEELRKRETERESLVAELNSDLDKIKSELAEREKRLEEESEKASESAKRTSEALEEVQLKENELERFKKSVKRLEEEFGEKEKAFEEERNRLVAENENKLTVLKNEIEFINMRHEEDIGNYEENLNSEVKEANEKMADAEKTSAELLVKLERIIGERDELKTREEEKDLKIAELENCVTALKTELDEKFHEDVEKQEESSIKQEEKVKEIILQYDSEVADRDLEIESFKRKLAEMEDAEEIKKRHENEVRQIIVRYDTEIAQRDEEIESLKLKSADDEATVERLKSELKRVEMELREKGENRSNLMGFGAVEEKGKEDSRSPVEVEAEKSTRESTETCQKKEVEGLNSSKEMTAIPDMEDSKPAAMEEVDLGPAGFKATVPTSSEVSPSSSIELLQRQLIQQAEEMKELKRQYRKEINEMKKSSWKKKPRKNSPENQDWFYSGVGRLENDTEHEYLRNILYEYMMGREQLVLAKVLSAIVKFNEEQTHNVLEKEQQRQTLFGQLSLI